LIEQREDTAACINKAAASVGLSNRFDIQRDVDYRSNAATRWRALDGGIADSLAVLARKHCHPAQSERYPQQACVQRGICAVSL